MKTIRTSDLTAFPARLTDELWVVLEPKRERSVTWHRIGNEGAWLDDHALVDYSNLRKRRVPR